MAEGARCHLEDELRPVRERTPADLLRDDVPQGTQRWVEEKYKARPFGQVLFHPAHLRTMDCQFVDISALCSHAF